MKHHLMRRVGLLLTTAILLLFLLGLAIPSASAETVGGTWTSRIPGEGYVDDTGACTYHRDVRLVLSGPNNKISGQVTFTIRSVDINIAGFEECRDFIGTSETNVVSGALIGTSFTMKMGTITYNLKVSGDKMTGSGTYESGGVTVSWTFDLTGGGEGPSFLPSPGLFAIPLSTVAFSIGGISILVSFIARPLHEIGPVTGTTVAPTPVFQPGAPVSGVQHMGYMWDIPSGARPIPTDHPVLQPQPGQQTDTLQKIPCPFCGSTSPLKLHLGSWYCTNTQCAWNNPPR